MWGAGGRYPGRCAAPVQPWPASLTHTPPHVPPACCQPPSVSAAFFASLIRLLHASLILINVWVSAGRSSSRDAATLELPVLRSRSGGLVLAPAALGQCPAEQLAPVAGEQGEQGTGTGRGITAPGLWGRDVPCRAALSPSTSATAMRARVGMQVTKSY